MRKLNGTIIVTYRCNSHCTMCNRWKLPVEEDELLLKAIGRLPRMYIANLTGGEPFMRTDLPDIVSALYRKSDRIVINTNGLLGERIIELCKAFPKVGIRVSIDGKGDIHDRIRGVSNNFDRAMHTLETLWKMGHKDIGFSTTVQDANAAELLQLYRLATSMGMEFATMALHNSFYYGKTDNVIRNRSEVAAQVEDLINELLKSGSPKKWFRAYYNHGLIYYLLCGRRLSLSCEAGNEFFIMEPNGDILSCTGSREKWVMGNLNRQTWAELWYSSTAEWVRKKVHACDHPCWMPCSVNTPIRRHPAKPTWWVLKHKLRQSLGMKYSAHELLLHRTE